MTWRLFLILFLLFGILDAKEYPQTFSKLATPLFNASEKLSTLLTINSLNPEIQKFQKSIALAINDGKEVDKTQKKQAIKNYLLELRKLQKNYDYLLYLIHKEIEKSIKAKEYKKFIELISCKLDGLLEKKNIQIKAIAYYEKNRHIQKSALLEKKIKEEALLEATTQEFYNEIVKSTYDSNDKKSHYKKSVFLSTTRVNNTIKIFFSNSNFYDVTVHVQGKYQNLKESPNTVHKFVIKAKSTRPYTTLSMTKGESSYSFSYGWIMGNKNAIHNDAYLYRFPYTIGTSHRISQGYNGKYTHKGNSRYALDFAMKEGTKIYAAREGVVVKTKSSSNIGGYKKKFARHGNYVTIAHNDGTFAIYYHLKQHGVVVKIGEKVEKGALIAYSGNTGYTSGPHLHFAVFSAISARATHTIATKFLDENGIVENPTQGRAYIAK